MQMLTYLDVVITHAPKWLGKEATPAGVLYFHVHNPLIQSEQALSEEKLEQERLKKFKMKGLVLHELEALELMDLDIKEKPSDIIPVGFKKDGNPTKYSRVATREEFNVIRSYVRDMTKTIGTKLTNGITDISPYRLKKETPCTFCEFRAVCQFDQSFEENNYRSLKVKDAENVLKKMLEERKTDR